MVNIKEKTIIKQCGQKYNAALILLFGSSLQRNAKANDIDLAVKGVKPELFFSFCGELLKLLPKPVDVVDLDDIDGYFAQSILSGGKVLYEA